MEKIIILGGGGHAESLVDAIESQRKYEVAGYVVNETADVKTDRRYPIIGTDDDLEKIFQNGIRNAALGIGYLGRSSVREKLWDILKRIGYCLPVICDPSAILARDVKLEEGCFVGKRAVLNARASIGKGCIINTGAIVEHDCCVDEFSHISVGTVLCGGVKVGKAAFIGANATIIQEVNIGMNAIIGAGSVVVGNVPDNSRVVGLGGMNH